jgi:hypothetical protein
MAPISAPDPVPPSPDEKDWTWVLTTPCPECGFNAAEFEATDVADLLHQNSADWEQILRGDDAVVRRRPSPATWSPLGYACHVRDVHVLYLERLELMLNEDGPQYPNWDQDETALAERYHEVDPTTVAVELRAAADALADRFRTAADGEWEQTGYRNDGAEFTVTTFAKYFIHDPIHHVHDARIG